MRWFGFGFNAFAQICVPEKSEKEESNSAVGQEKVCVPVELVNHIGRSKIRASWSRRASLFLDEESCVRLAGFCASISNESFSPVTVNTSDCQDAVISETHLTLAFPDRIESWDLQSKDKTPSWSMEMAQSQNSAKSLALGGEHAILLTAAGAVYTWGQGSHGQLGHGGLIPEEEPRTVEALWGMSIRSVAAGGWHSVCVGDGGDLYVWGWNESGQLGLPSRGLRKASQQKSDQQAGEQCSSFSTRPDEELHEEVFISIQAFPALVDVSPSCEISTVSCGSRHTAAVTTTGYLYTWGWGEYGQLGHQTTSSLDEPQCVEFFRTENLHVVDVVCGSWNTFTAAVKKEVLGLKNVPQLPPVSTASELWTTC
ncbi:RCC1 domain-containing protein 1-like isoform X2 [Gambusia affinis]|uniref:RCC1 domain-containing protein 1-like isoform X2 n=1 Tax=Gambusia affinis TaxID=33528 RepID=UPI001CDC5490|nr:RCC1 domain-containing protein 1-like isoform X2 [Gambusia affinis]